MRSLGSSPSSIREITVSDIIDQRTLTESANTVTDDTLETPTDLLDRARQHATNVAAEHFPDLAVETNDWEISHRAQRQAGATKYDPATGEIMIALTWTAYVHHGWEQFSATIRHELIHAWQYHEFGEADHGSTFTRWTPSTPRDTGNTSPRKSGGSSARTAVIELLVIDARKQCATRSSTVVASAAVQFASKRATATDRILI